MSNFPFLLWQTVWIEDLKTTSAPQTIENLFRKRSTNPNKPAGYCCLGRICVLENLKDMNPDLPVARFMCNVGVLPSNMAEKYKLRSDLGYLKVPVKISDELHCNSLTDLNDKARWTFKQIGEYIEANPENVFTNLEE